MNEQYLSKRLKAVVSYIPKGAIVADIGSDHAYLPCYAYNNGLIKGAVAGEVNEGPYLSAKKQVEKLGMNDAISVRKGSGLAVIAPKEVNVITVAGMGGGLIRDILEEGKEKLEGVERLVLQPNVAADKIRIWLHKNNWLLISEEILEEDGKIYEVLAAERGNDKSLYQNDKLAAFLLGPYLMKEKNAVFQKKWSHELEKRRKIIKQLESASNNEEKVERKKLILQEIKRIEEGLS
ncbi:tRNA (adenine(22)-N(1))-methyltransferase [Bacillus taeanensis]|uniref:tRNA (Adenine(22)-N(1))-methyltransferase TrmK n=1 Tax=Bacillus taeanensis TaxID=273032 RepID=A0A366Y2U1_9BACI|nr:tRNA (adenine(22)-N(1))-methyltransferase TrmK [Bacillus taeanensis]RBW70521.1 tRNA (adenine(22)-N(1))-methyltransferase TrmK [Bacillus taeanensis]